MSHNFTFQLLYYYFVKENVTLEISDWY